MSDSAASASSELPETNNNNKADAQSVKNDAPEDQENKKKLDALRRKDELRRRQAEAITKKRTDDDAPISASTTTTKDGDAPSSTSSVKTTRPKVIRKDQVENAVKFLTHDKVKSSPLTKRIAFLEHKGLNDDEIAAALKAAGISAEDAANAVASPSTSTSSSASDERPALPARNGNIAALPPPPPPSSSMRPLVLTALLSLGLAGGGAYFATKYFNHVEQKKKTKRGKKKDKKKRSTASTSTTPQKEKEKERDGGEDIQLATYRAFKGEIDSLRAGHKELTKEVQETFAAMRSMLELPMKQQQARPSSPASSTTTTTITTRPSVSRDEEMETLRAEVKGLRAKMMDQQHGPNMIARSIAQGKDEQATVTIPKTTTTAENSQLPAWLHSAPKRQLVEQAAPSTVTVTTSTSTTEPAVANAEQTPADEATQPAAEQTTTTTTTTTTTPTATTTEPSTAASEAPAKRDRPMKPYQLKQKPAAGTRSPLLQKVDKPTEDNNTNSSTDDNKSEEGAASENAGADDGRVENDDAPQSQ